MQLGSGVAFSEADSEMHPFGPAFPLDLLMSYQLECSMVELVVLLVEDVAILVALEGAGPFQA